MCLLSRYIEPEIAKEDIKVFKIVKVMDSGYFSPFMLAPLRETPEEECVQINGWGFFSGGCDSRKPIPLYQIGCG